jgi:glycosyltransferase involved in cell wall biosynthesis
MEPVKPRILVVNEFSELSTGFSTYMKYMLPELYRSGKYEIAELATYVAEDHPLIYNPPWPVYVNDVRKSRPDLAQAYNSMRDNQFGRFRFEEVLLDFQPTHVISIRDYWMDAFIPETPYKRHFHWITMPTVDGDPQKMEWLEAYEKADCLLTYSLWAKNLLERQSGGKLKVFGVASPGTDVETFKPVENKAEARSNAGLQEDIFIIQTVMRNQGRKLFPDLFRAFNLFLQFCQRYGYDDLAKKTFLYCHTSVPDVGWDLADELKRHNLSHKVLFTYMCPQTKRWFPSFYGGETTASAFTGQYCARMPSASLGVDKNQLAEIMGLADLYVQYSVCEGFGMPINDAKACGVPCLVVDYSAMSEQAYNGGALPITVQRFFQEPITQTNQLRALPDNLDLAEMLLEFFRSKPEHRQRMADEAIQCVHNFYTYDKVAKVWADAIDSLPAGDLVDWSAPPRMINPPDAVPPGMDPTTFLNWCCVNILQEPDRANSSFVRQNAAALACGYYSVQDEHGRPTKVPCTHQSIVDMMLNKVKYNNLAEQKRCGLEDSVQVIEL